MPTMRAIGKPGMHVFGLTGGIATGKSTIANHWRERGLPVLDADALAREAVAPGSAGLREVIREFGPCVQGATGELDRSRMAALVFRDLAGRRRLEAIVHPLVQQLFAARRDGLRQAGHPIACYEVPLLFEVGLDADLAPVVVVVTEKPTQLARLRMRSGLNAEQAHERISSQMPLAEKASRADYVIDNDLDRAAARLQADAVLQDVCRRFGVPAQRYGL